jgi:multiple sugar transport system ATP-binding protein
MIYVTHDQVEAMTLGQRIVVINGGRIEQVGTPQALYQQPANLFVAGFLGAPKMNFIQGQIVSVSAAGATVRLAGGALITAAVDARRAAPGESVTLGIRAEHMPLDADGDNGLDLVVGHVEYLGDQSVAYASLTGEAALVAVRQAADGTPLRPGMTVRARLPAQHCHLFDSTGSAYLHSLTIAC